EDEVRPSRKLGGRPELSASEPGSFGRGSPDRRAPFTTNGDDPLPMGPESDALPSDQSGPDSPTGSWSAPRYNRRGVLGAGLGGAVALGVPTLAARAPSGPARQR